MSRYPVFRVRFLGFDRREVVGALAKLASENEEARREIERLGDEMDRLQGSMVEQHGSERHVQRALMAASKAADEMIERAEEEARLILRDAKDRGEVMTQQLRDQARGIEGQIEALLTKRREVEASLEAFIKVITEDLGNARQHTAQSAEPASSPLAKTG